MSERIIGRIWVSGIVFIVGCRNGIGPFCPESTGVDRNMSLCKGLENDDGLVRLKSSKYG